MFQKIEKNKKYKFHLNRYTTTTMASNQNSLGLSTSSFMPENPYDPYWRQEILLIEAQCSRWENFLSSEKFEENNKFMKDWLTEHMRLAREGITAEARGDRALATFWYRQKEIHLKTNPWWQE